MKHEPAKPSTAARDLFFVADVITIAGLIMFPGIVTWLPEVLGVR